jgi:FMN reductase
MTRSLTSPMEERSARGGDAHVLAVDGSPQGHGRTAVVLREVLRGASASGATTDVMTLADVTLDEAVDALEEAHGVVIGTPVYRASFAYPLKALLDQLPRGMWGETRAPLQGKAVAMVATGASLHHFLALDDLRNVLANFFAAHVLPPGLYVPRGGLTDADGLDPDLATQAERQGQAVVELTLALRECPALRGLVAQA